MIANGALHLRTAINVKGRVLIRDSAQHTATPRHVQLVSGLFIADLLLLLLLPSLTRSRVSAEIAESPAAKERGEKSRGSQTLVRCPSGRLFAATMRKQNPTAVN